MQRPDTRPAGGGPAGDGCRAASPADSMTGPMARRRARRRPRRRGDRPGDSAAASAQRRALAVGLSLAALVGFALYLVWRQPVRPLTVATLAPAEFAEPASVPFAAVPDFRAAAGAREVAAEFGRLAEANRRFVAEPLVVEQGLLPGTGRFPSVLLLYAAGELTADPGAAAGVMLTPPGGPPIKLTEFLSDAASRAEEGLVVVIDRVRVPPGFAGQGMTAATEAEVRDALGRVGGRLWAVLVDADRAAAGTTSAAAGAVRSALRRKTRGSLMSVSDFCGQVVAASGGAAKLLASPAGDGATPTLLADRAAAPPAADEPAAEESVDGEGKEPADAGPGGPSPEERFAALLASAAALDPAAVGAAEYHRLQCEVVAAHHALAAGDDRSFRRFHDAAARRVPAASAEVAAEAGVDGADDGGIAAALDAVREAPNRNLPPRLPAEPGPRRDAVAAWFTAALSIADEETAAELTRVAASLRAANPGVRMPAEMLLAESVLSGPPPTGASLGTLTRLLRTRRRLTNAAGLTGGVRPRAAEWAAVSGRVAAAEADLREAAGWLSAGPLAADAAEERITSAAAAADQIEATVRSLRGGGAAVRRSRVPWLLQAFARRADAAAADATHRAAAAERRMPDGVLNELLARAMRSVGDGAGPAFDAYDDLAGLAPRRLSAVGLRWLPWPVEGEPGEPPARADAGVWTAYWSIRSLAEAGAEVAPLWPAWEAVAAAESPTPAARGKLASDLAAAWETHFAEAPPPARTMSAGERADALNALDAGLGAGGSPAEVDVRAGKADPEGNARLLVSGEEGTPVYVRTAGDVQLVRGGAAVRGGWSRAGDIGPGGRLEVDVRVPAGRFAEVHVLAAARPPARPAIATTTVAPSADADWDVRILYAAEDVRPLNLRVPGPESADEAAGGAVRTLDLLPAADFPARLRLERTGGVVPAARVRLLSGGREVAAATADVSGGGADVVLEFADADAEIDLLRPTRIEVTPVLADGPAEDSARLWTLTPRFAGPRRLFDPSDLAVRDRSVRLDVRLEDPGDLGPQVPGRVELQLTPGPRLRPLLPGGGKPAAREVDTRDRGGPVPLRLEAGEDLADLSPPAAVWLACPQLGWHAGWIWEVPSGDLLSRDARVAVADLRPALEEGQSPPPLSPDGALLLSGARADAAVPGVALLFSGAEWPRAAGLRVAAETAGGDRRDLLTPRPAPHPVVQEAALVPAEGGEFRIRTRAAPFDFDLRARDFSGDNLQLTVTPAVSAEDAGGTPDRVRPFRVVVDRTPPRARLEYTRRGGRDVVSTTAGRPFPYVVRLSDEGSGLAKVSTTLTVAGGEPQTKDLFPPFEERTEARILIKEDEVPAGDGVLVTLEFTAHDAVGNASEPARLEFRVLPAGGGG